MEREEEEEEKESRKLLHYVADRGRHQISAPNEMSHYHHQCYFMVFPFIRGLCQR